MKIHLPQKIFFLILGLFLLFDAGSVSAYDRSQALAFAQDQWNVPVYSGHEYPYSGIDRLASGSGQPGYACAEFVSRALQAGGLDILNQCTGYKLCSCLYEWLLSSGAGTVVESADSLNAGDIIFYREAGSPKEWSHVTMVINSETKSICAHNKARWDVPWTWGVVNPEEMSFIKINDQISGFSVQSSAPSIPVLPPMPTLEELNMQDSSGNLPKEASHSAAPQIGKIQSPQMPADDATTPKPENSVVQVVSATSVEPPAPVTAPLEKTESHKPGLLTRITKKIFGNHSSTKISNPSPEIEPSSKGKEISGKSFVLDMGNSGKENIDREESTMQNMIH